MTILEPAYEPSKLAEALVLVVDATLRTPAIRQALYDVLRIYGITAQIGELVGNQRTQIQALAEAMTLFHATLIEHDRKAAADFNEIAALMQLVHSLLEHQDGPDGTIAIAAGEVEDLRPKKVPH